MACLHDGTGVEKPDFLAVVDARTGAIVHELPMPNSGDELHHFGWNRCSSACCDLAVVQGGLTTAIELTANRRPFLFSPLRHHFEQNTPSATASRATAPGAAWTSRPRRPP